MPHKGRGSAKHKKSSRPLPTPTFIDDIADAFTEQCMLPGGSNTRSTPLDPMVARMGNSPVPASIVRPQVFAPEDGDQTPLWYGPAQALRDVWGDGMDFDPPSMMPGGGVPSLWTECFQADTGALKRRTDWSQLEARISQVCVSQLSTLSI